MFSNVVVLGGDLTSPQQISEIAGLKSQPQLIPCSALEEYTEDDAIEDGSTGEDTTSLGCCIIDDHALTLLRHWAYQEQRNIKRILTTNVQGKPANTSEANLSLYWLYPMRFFVYGRLCDPDLWLKTLGLPTAPTFVDAKVRGYEVKMLGDDQALLFVRLKSRQKSEDEVAGKMYMVRDKAMVERIAAYYTDKYRLTQCRIDVKSGEENMLGFCFLFVGDKSELITLKDYDHERQDRLNRTLFAPDFDLND